MKKSPSQKRVRSVPEKRRFTGQWIPAWLYLDMSLTWTEKIFWLEVDSLDRAKYGCLAENRHFADFLGVSIRHVQNLISKFVSDSKIDIEFIEIDGKERRKLVSRMAEWALKAQQTDRETDDGHEPEFMGHELEFMGGMNSSSLSSIVQEYNTNNTTGSGSTQEIQASINTQDRKRTQKEVREVHLEHRENSQNKNVRAVRRNPGLTAARLSYDDVSKLLRSSLEKSNERNITAMAAARETLLKQGQLDPAFGIFYKVTQKLLSISARRFSSFIVWDAKSRGCMNVLSNLDDIPAYIDWWFEMTSGNGRGFSWKALASPGWVDGFLQSREKKSAQRSRRESSPEELKNARIIEA